MPLVPEAELTELSEEILRGAGVPAEARAVVTGSLVRANLAGHDSHGLMKLPSYIRDIRAGALDARAEPRVVKEVGALAMIDGGGGFGHLAARCAVDLAIDKACRLGMSAVTVAHAHHTGRLGNWTELIAAEGLVGAAFGGEAQSPYMVAPFGGRSGALATNPMSWAVPRGHGAPPVLLDYATSVVSIGKLQVARGTIGSVPPGWLLDHGGDPTERLEDFFDGGLLLPFGGYKGYALSVIADLLAVGLSGGRAFSPDERSSCLLLLAVDPEALGGVEQLSDHADGLIARLTAVAAQEPTGGVLIPGDPEQRARAERAGGVPIPDEVWERLCTLRAELRVGPDGVAGARSRTS